MISQQLDSHTLSEDEELVSFDVSSLYTKMPVTEAINVWANLLFRESSKKLPVDNKGKKKAEPFLEENLTKLAEKFSNLQCLELCEKLL